MGKRLRGITNSNGFTLIELLLVVSIIGFIMAVSLPVSYNMYLSYEASLKAEKVLIFISRVRRESFLYSRESLIYTKEGVIQSDDGQGNVTPVALTDIFVQGDAPLKFYKNGTTSGGLLKIYAGGFVYQLHVKPPFGDLLLEKGT